MSSHASLSAAADERKARLAKLKSLKRKAPDESQDIETDDTATTTQQDDQNRSSTPDVSKLYLSGRNFDAETKGPKLGFEANPAEGQTTLEAQAAALAERTKAEAAANDAADKPLDLFKLQPKKPNWDLKRDLDRKLEVLNVRTENAIARLVKERIENAQKEARKKAGAGAGEVEVADREGEAVGMEGAMLAEAMREREREDEADRVREKEDEELV
ncbi:mRNA splicing factor Cwf18 [Macrophomina phaseolina MS6]|uniref:mRNA splicing factor Cwf18 n=2 Tax=Macrophomina phaseolina TaxID=35725 RepID=K2S4K3_MACPH|nr:mRNA splicing factor Cwf18 [Macrophomina phaseolina MS6]KAH7061404.1 cwf18 pre-mRNA splicing factor-domain-containing protein [Macrophomina phaseolina]